MYRIIFEIILFLKFKSLIIIFFFLQPNQKLHELRQKGLKIDIDHGTTTLGFRFKNGVILAVDSRATGGQCIGKFNFLYYLNH